MKTVPLIITAVLCVSACTAENKKPEKMVYDGYGGYGQQNYAPINYRQKYYNQNLPTARAMPANQSIVYKGGDASEQSRIPDSDWFY